MKLILRILPLVALVFAVSGCTALRQNAARQRYIHTQLEDMKYARPLSEVWPNVRQILFERGYQVRDSSHHRGAYAVETEELWTYSGASGTGTRYLVQGVTLEDGSSKVIFTRQQTSSFEGRIGSTQSSRDFDLEWELLQRVNPSYASEIDYNAEAWARQNVN